MENYNFYQRFLHDFILGNSFIKKSLFEIEKLIYLKKLNLKKKTCFYNWPTKIRINNIIKFSILY